MKKFIFIFTLLVILALPHSASADQILDGELFYAVSVGDIDETRRLLSKGADPNVRNKESGYSALMASCLFSNDMIVRLLLNAGTDVNMRTIRGESALYYAVQKDNLPLVALLLSYNADAGIKTVDGTALYDIARRNRNEPLMAMLAKAQNKIVRSNYPPIPYQTSLVILDEVKIIRAREEAQLFPTNDRFNTLLFYQLSFNAIQNLIDESVLKKSPHPSVLMITPYSLLRYNYAVADRKNDLPAMDMIKTLTNHKDTVWLRVRGMKTQPHVDKVMLKIGDNLYPPLAREHHHPAKLLAAAGIDTLDTWAFPIELFSSRNLLTEIVVSYPDGSSHIVKLKAEQFEKVPLK